MHIRKGLCIFNKKKTINYKLSPSCLLLYSYFTLTCPLYAHCFYTTSGQTNSRDIHMPRERTLTLFMKKLLQKVCL